MQYYLILKVWWLFNSFLTKMFKRSTNVALAGNGSRLCEAVDFKKQMFNLKQKIKWKTKVQN